MSQKALTPIALCDVVELDAPDLVLEVKGGVRIDADGESYLCASPLGEVLRAALGDEIAAAFEVAL